MENRELDRILKSFKKVKAPRELDERLAPYLVKRDKKIKITFLRLGIGFAAIFLFVSLYYLINRQKPSNFFNEPLYASSVCFGYFDTKIETKSGDNLSVSLDGETLVDTTFSQKDTFSLQLDLSPGFHYIVIEVENTYDYSKYTKVLDIYSL